MIVSKPAWQLGWAAPSPDDLPSAQFSALLDTLQQAGYAGVQTMIGEPYRLTAEKFQRLLGERGLSLIGVRTGDIFAHHGLRLSDPDPHRRQQAVQALCEVIAYASMYGTPKILVGLMQGQLRQGESRDLALGFIAEGLSAAASVAQRYGMLIGLEPVNRYLVGYNQTIEEVQALIDRAGGGNLQLLIDTFHMNIEEADIPGSVMRAAGKIGDVHLADSNRRSPGGGHFDFESFFTALSQAGYRDSVTVECDPLPDPSTAAIWAARYLQKWTNPA